LFLKLLFIFTLEFESQLITYFQVMANQEAVDIAIKIKDPQKAAKQLTAEALKRESRDDISCIVVRFK
jgi:protein phosphatase 1L